MIRCLDILQKCEVYNSISVCMEWKLDRKSRSGKIQTHLIEKEGKGKKGYGYS